MKTFDVFNVEDLTPYHREQPHVDVLEDDGTSNTRSSSSKEGQTDDDLVLWL